MPDEGLHWPSLTLRVVYEDLPDLIQVEAQIAADGWSGIVWAYTSPHSLGEEARGLLNWAERLSGEFALEAGADTGIGWLSLRWYVIDRAGHLACHVRITRLGPPRSNPAINPMIAPPGPMTNAAVILASRDRSKALSEKSSIAQ